MTEEVKTPTSPALTEIMSQLEARMTSPQTTLEQQNRHPLMDSNEENNPLQGLSPRNELNQPSVSDTVVAHLEPQKNRAERRHADDIKSIEDVRSEIAAQSIMAKSDEIGETAPIAEEPGKLVDMIRATDNEDEIRTLLEGKSREELMQVAQELMVTDPSGFMAHAMTREDQNMLTALNNPDDGYPEGYDIAASTTASEATSPDAANQVAVQPSVTEEKPARRGLFGLFRRSNDDKPAKTEVKPVIQSQEMSTGRKVALVGGTATVVVGGGAAILSSGNSAEAAPLAVIQPLSPGDQAAFDKTGTGRKSEKFVTGYSVSGSFYDFFEKNGGIAQQGYPTTDVIYEKRGDKIYQVQYFERSVLELHPENDEANRVQLTLLGTQEYDKNKASIEGQPTPTTSDLGGFGTETVTFPETGKTVSGLFLKYWRDNGGLVQQGLPRSDMKILTGSDGQKYVTQYFERAVFEYHPQNSAQWKVLLSLLGNDRYNNLYGEGDVGGQDPDPTVTPPEPPKPTEVPAPHYEMPGAPWLTVEVDGKAKGEGDRWMGMSNKEKGVPDLVNSAMSEVANQLGWKTADNKPDTQRVINELATKKRIDGLRNPVRRLDVTQVGDYTPQQASDETHSLIVVEGRPLIKIQLSNNIPDGFLPVHSGTTDSFSYYGITSDGQLVLGRSYFQINGITDEAAFNLTIGFDLDAWGRLGEAKDMNYQPPNDYYDKKISTEFFSGQGGKVADRNNFMAGSSRSPSYLMFSAQQP